MWATASTELERRGQWLKAVALEAPKAGSDDRWTYLARASGVHSDPLFGAELAPSHIQLKGVDPRQSVKKLAKSSG